jgi:predicted nucleic acid-binding protein
VGAAPLALDACVLINLCATDRVPEIARALETTFVVAREASRETLYLRSDESADALKVKIELQPLIDQNVVEIADLWSNELTTFVALAQELDEGEAATLALAFHRHKLLATDDRAALRLIVAGYTDIAVRSTAQLLRLFCEATSMPTEDAAACIRAIERRASFRPSPTDPEAEWWRLVSASHS